MAVKWWGPTWKDRWLTIVLAIAFVSVEILWSQRYRFALVVAAAVTVAFVERRARRLEKEREAAVLSEDDDWPAP